MPSLAGESSAATGSSSFGFSRQRLADLQATEYTLVCIYVDASGSVHGFAHVIEDCLQSVIESCRSSPRAGNLLIRIVLFATDLHVVHEFRLLKEIKADEYRGVIKPSGMTCLLDAAIDMYQSFTVHGRDLRDNDYEVNAIGFVITDGEDTASTHSSQRVADNLKTLQESELLDSYRTIVISINNSDPHFHNAMQDFASKCGFDQVVDAGQADVKSLAKLAAFVSQSISSQSSQLGTGQPSQAITF